MRHSRITTVNILLVAIVIICYWLLEVKITSAIEINLTRKFKGKILFQKEEQIFILDGQTGKVKQLTKRGSNYEPKWSPDGKLIAFASQRDGHRLEIYVMNADGTNQQRITYSRDGSSVNPRWVGNGRRLYVSSSSGNLKSENIVNLTTGEVSTIDLIDVPFKLRALPFKEIITEIEAKKQVENIETGTKNLLKKIKGICRVFPSWDGKQIIRHNQFSFELILTNMEDKTETTLLRGSEPSWSKDNKKIAYFLGGGLRNTLAIYDISTKRYEKVIVPISPDKYNDCDKPSWDRDSSEIAYSCFPIAGPGEYWLFIYDIKNKSFTKLIQGYNPDWY